MVKAELEQRITDRAGVIAAARKVLEAEAAVTKAENSYSQADLNAAQVFAKALPDGEVKTAFQQRINAVQDIIDADSAVKTAESSTLQSDVDTAQSFVTALPDGTAKTALQNRINTVQGIINDRIVQLENADAVSHAKLAVEGAIYDITQAEANTELDVLTAIEAVISGLALEGATASVTKQVYTPAIDGSELTPNGSDGSYTFTVTLSKGAGPTLASDITNTLSMNITATVYVPPEIITSKEIVNFNFATIESSTAMLISKPFAIDEGYDFRGANAKSFTITDGAGNVIPVNLSWELPRKDTGYSTATLIGSAIESAIQDYFNAHGGLDNRTLWSACFEFNTGTTFTLSSFAEGVLNKITIDGTDGAYFFNELSAQGTDLDTSANRFFSVSDGAHTANISLNSDLSNMDGLVNKLNSSLSGYSVQAVAVKISENSFKIVGDDITVEGADIAKFFSSYISE
jgi:predicted heme/steroid binding protein